VLYERSIDRYLQAMLPKSVICPRCHKAGFLTLRWVRSIHYCKIEIPNYQTQWVWKKVLNPLVGDGQERTTFVKRNVRRYAPYWHLYIGHYDAEKYKKAMEKYKSGRLKSRPNGRLWHKVRYNRVRGQAQSDLEILMAKYNFDLRDLRNEERARREDFLLKRGIL
jgi:hypothetical protein